MLLLERSYYGRDMYCYWQGKSRSGRGRFCSLVLGELGHVTGRAELGFRQQNLVERDRSCSGRVKS